MSSSLRRRESLTPPLSAQRRQCPPWNWHRVLPPFMTTPRVSAAAAIVNRDRRRLRAKIPSDRPSPVAAAAVASPTNVTPMKSSWPSPRRPPSSASMRRTPPPPPPCPDGGCSTTATTVVNITTCRRCCPSSSLTSTTVSEAIGRTCTTF